MKNFWKITRSVGTRPTARPAVEALESRDTPANVYVVSNLLDAGPGSLRNAVSQANAHIGPDLVRFAPGLAGNIQLTTGAITISDDVSVAGPGAGRLAVDGGGNDRIFDLPNLSREGQLRNVFLSGLTLHNGQADSDGGAIRNFASNLTITGCLFFDNAADAGDEEPAFGGAIAQYGASLTVQSSGFQGNSATGDGGAIYFTPSGEGTETLTLRRAILDGNSSGDPDFFVGAGGAVFAANGTVLVEDSIITGNGASEGAGGALALNFADTTIRRSAIAGNTASGEGGSGGGIDFEGPKTLTLENVTLSDNGSDADGGAIHFAGTLLVVRSTTVASNDAGGDGGGLFVASGTANLHNSIFEDNHVGEEENNDISGNFGEGQESFALQGGVTINATYCLIQAGTVNGIDDHNLFKTSANLGPLKFNGGPTPTRALLPGSPAINQGDPSLADAPPTDQRGPGFHRVIGGRQDIGAYEFQPAAVTGQVRSSAPVAAVGQPVTFTASFRGVAAGSNVPQGTAIFFIDGRAVAAVRLVNGVAHYTTATLAPGAHRVWATYVPAATGDYTFDPFTTPAIAQLVVGSQAFFRHYFFGG